MVKTTALFNARYRGDPLQPVLKRPVRAALDVTFELNGRALTIRAMVIGLKNKKFENVKSVV